MDRTVKTAIVRLALAGVLPYPVADALIRWLRLRGA
jgi:hypothetical protein